MKHKHSHVKDYRVTHQRRIILDYVRKRADHLTAEQIYKGVKNVLSRISFGTVYRNLEFLTRHGYIRAFPVNNVSHFERRVDAHIHFRCHGCGRIFDIDRGNFFREHYAILRDTGFLVHDQLVEFSGLCQECQERGRVLQRNDPFCIACGHIMEDIEKHAQRCEECTFQAHCLYQVSQSSV